MKYKKLHNKAYPIKSLYKQINNKSVATRNIHIENKSKLFKFNNLILKNINLKISLNSYGFLDNFQIFNHKRVTNYSLVILLISPLAFYVTLSRLSTDNSNVAIPEVQQLKSPESTINNNFNTPTTTIEISTSNTTLTTTTIPVTTTTLKPTFVVTNIKEAQIQLKNLFIYQGEIDGINGTYTKLSIKEFQKRSGLETDGILGPITKAGLTNGKNSYINIEEQESIDNINLVKSQ